jgi:hypothetical protein
MLSLFSTVNTSTMVRRSAQSLAVASYCYIILMTWVLVRSGRETQTQSVEKSLAEKLLKIVLSISFATIWSKRFKMNFLRCYNIISPCVHSLLI